MLMNPTPEYQTSTFSDIEWSDHLNTGLKSWISNGHLNKNYRENIFVKRSIPTVCFALTGVIICVQANKPWSVQLKLPGNEKEGEILYRYLVNDWKKPVFRWHLKQTRDRATSYTSSRLVLAIWILNWFGLIQWGSEYPTSLVFEWLKVVR